ADRVALHEDVHAEPCTAGQRVRHVQFELLLEPLAHLLREDRVDHPLEGAGGERWIVLQPLELTVDPDGRGRARRQVKVRAVQIEEPAEQFRNGDLHVLIRRGNCAHRHFTTLATSSSDVMPMRAFSSPSSRSVIIPCCTATALIASAEERSTVSRSISSLICITSYRPIRPR